MSLTTYMSPEEVAEEDRLIDIVQARGLTATRYLIEEERQRQSGVVPTKMSVMAALVRELS